MRVVVLGGEAKSLTNFRLAMLRTLVAQGHEILALAGNENAGVRQTLRDAGVAYQPVPLERAGLNPLRDLALLLALTRVFRAFRADVVLAYTAKPVVYGMLAARLAGVDTRAAMITGVGSILTGKGSRRWLGVVLRTLYTVALRQAGVIFFQNPDDEQLFRNLGLVHRRAVVQRINGSGVDLAHFASAPLPPRPPTVFLMIARLLRDKGVCEYVEAARRIRARHPDTRFQLLGGLDPNPSSIRRSELDSWIADGTIEYLGTTDDVRPYLARAHVYVLPSYSEGTPRSVLEAMATGRPILTTDAPGCRETVIDAHNGRLVAPRCAEALAEGMEALLSGPARLDAMGRRSRELAEERFDVHRVNEVILSTLALWNGPSLPPREAPPPALPGVAAGSQ